MTLCLGVFVMAAAAFAQGSSDGKAVTLSGTLRGDRVAVGGESSGWSLQYRDASGSHTIEVQLPKDLATRPAAPALVTMTGSFGTREYVERGTVRIFRVTRITKDRPAPADSSGAAAPTLPLPPNVKRPQ
jgi:hypothetical protein